MSEVVTLHVGQAGVDVAAPLWELYCRDHGVALDGSLAAGDVSSRLSPFFIENSQSKFSPRALLVDSDPETIAKVRKGPGRKLFSGGLCVAGREDAAALYPLGRYGPAAYNLSAQTLERLRLLAEASDCLQGLVAAHSMGGGTGSGLGCLLLDKIAYHFPKKPILQFAVLPSRKMSTSSVEPYNALLMAALTSGRNKCCCLSDNEAMYKYVERQAGLSGASLRDLNWVTSHVVSGVTAPLRLPGSTPCSLGDLLTSLVPAPSLRYPVAGLAVSRDRAESPWEAVRACFAPHLQLASLDPRRGRYLACLLAYRGAAPQLAASLGDLLAEGSLPGWGALRTCCSPAPPPAVPSSVLGPVTASVATLAATTAVSQLWGRLLGDFNAMLSKKAFLSWYLSNGMEFSQFQDTQEKGLQLIDQYTLMTS